MGGGKSQTSTSSVQIPPEVLARYNSVNAQAQNVAQTPFTPYSQDPNAFVAPLNSAQTGGINQVAGAAGQAQPYFGAATGMTLAGAGSVNPQALQTNQYMNPYIQSVVDPTVRALQQQQGQQLSQQQSEAIKGGAFGGDRSGLARAQLEGQQNLAMGQAIAPLYSQGYTQAQQVAAQQQGVDLAAQQANQARLMQAGQQIAGLGTGAQAANIQGGQAALQAGTAAQQTDQAGRTALYNQFLQQQGYPFQVTQFLANIAEGTGALSGSTTSSTQPSSMFSDRRLKENVKVVGKTYDGQNIYRYNYKGDSKTQLGLIAQEVEHKHPDAVGSSQGYKTVNYDKATSAAADRGHFYQGGIVPSSMGGAVHDELAGEGFARGGYANGGGLLDSSDMAAFLAARQAMYAPFSGAGGPAGAGGTPGSKGIVPAANLPVPKLVTAAIPNRPQSSTLGDIKSAMSTGKDITEGYQTAKAGLLGTPGRSYTQDGKTFTEKAGQGLIGSGGEYKNQGWIGEKLGIKPSTGTPNATPGTVGQAQPVIGASAPAVTPASGPKVESAPDKKADLGSVEAPDRQIANLSADKGLGDIPASDIFAARGGVIGRHAYAVGGSPEDDTAPEGLYSPVGPGIGIPDEKSHDKLNAPPPPAASKDSTMSDIGTIMAMAKMGMSFSDSRLKSNAEKIGELFDGQPVYKYDMGDGKTQIGLMAQNVEKKHPQAVGLAHGYKTVNYDEATHDAAHRGHFYAGGIVRNGYAVDGTVVDPAANPDDTSYVDAEGKPVEKPKYRVEPVELSDMPEARQKMLQAIYGPESGGRYDIRQGGQETFDTNGPHPGKEPAKGGTSSAAGAGQFLNETWNRVTGGAPMQPGYQNAATWKLANDDYKSRTGRDLEADINEGGVTPDIKQALAPTWQAFAKPGAAAPKAAGLGSAASVSPSEPTSQGESEKGGIGKTIGDLATNEKFWIPLLSGLGTMASSPSRYLGSAILQGLGGGAQAYSDLEKRQAEIGQAKATTAQTEQNTYMSSFKETPYGNFLFLSNGGIMGAADYKRLQDAGKAPALLGKLPSNADQVVRDMAAKAAPAPQAPLAPGAAMAAAPAPKPADVVTPPPTPQAGVNYSPESKKAAQAESGLGFGGGLAAQDAIKTGGAYAQDVTKAAQVARENALNLGEMASNLASTVKNTGWETPGPTFNNRAKIAGLANVISRGFGGEDIFKDADTQAQIAGKLETMRGAIQAAGGGQESLAALNLLKAANANPEQNPKAFAELTSKMLAQSIRNIDQARHAAQYVKDSGGTYRDAAEKFENDNPKSRYNVESNVIKDLILQDPDAFSKMMNGKVPPAYIDDAFKKGYGLTGMSRWFTGR